MKEHEHLRLRCPDEDAVLMRKRTTAIRSEVERGSRFLK
jgi:hypothetical protein